MATFSDLATLLLTFFILLLSFAELNVIEFRDAVGSLREAFGVQFIDPGPIQAMSTTLVELNSMPTSPLTTVTQEELLGMRQMQQHIGEQGVEDQVEVLLSERGIVVRIENVLLFNTGSVELRPAAKAFIAGIPEIAENFGRGIAVEGHTDNRPIANERFPSNWELSAGRAASVVRYLISEHEIEPDRLTATGLAETQPVMSNENEANRQKNRRVEFIFERAKKSASESFSGTNATSRRGGAIGNLPEPGVGVGFRILTPNESNILPNDLRSYRSEVTGTGWRDASDKGEASNAISKEEQASEQDTERPTSSESMTDSIESEANNDRQSDEEGSADRERRPEDRE